MVTTTHINISSQKELTDLSDIPLYQVLLLPGACKITLDFTTYELEKQSLVFMTPYQVLKWETTPKGEVEELRFHGDFYCIEHHKKEVACNGILFNNIYESPTIEVDAAFYSEIKDLFRKIKAQEGKKESYDLSITRSYLCSREKQKEITLSRSNPINGELLKFQDLIEQHLHESQPLSFYAEYFGISENAFSKKIKKFFGKSPLRLIQEARVLEAKKQLHLTYRPVKEIAQSMGFEDEYYFSRFFRREVGVTPTKFREKVGISIVAEKSKE